LNYASEFYFDEEAYATVFFIRESFDDQLVDWVVYETMVLKGGSPGGIKYRLAI